MAARSATYNWNDFLTQVMFYILKLPDWDNIFKGFVALDNIEAHSKVEVDGGDRILVPLMYGKSPNFKWYRGAEELSTTANDPITNAEYEWKQAADAVTMTGIELRNQNGPQRIKTVLSSRVQNAMLTIRDNINSALYLDGTQDADAIEGFQLHIPVDPTTGTVGGIDRSVAANNWWRSYQANVGSYQLNGRAAMNKAYRQTGLGRPGGTPTMILCTDGAYGFIEDQLENKERYAMDTPKKGGPKSATVSFRTGVEGDIMFKDIPVKFDPNAPQISSKDVQWWINSRFFKFVCHPLAKFTSQPWRDGEKQDARYSLILFQGNMVMANARHNACLHTISA